VSGHAWIGGVLRILVTGGYLAVFIVLWR